MNCPVCNKLFTKKSGVWQDDKSKQVCLTVGDILHNRDILRVVTTNDKKVYEKLLYLRNQGRLNRGSFVHPEIGYNFRITDIQAAMGLEQLKIPSGEITNLPLLRHIGSLPLPILLSTGMSTLSEVEQAVKVLAESGARKEDMVVLHCC